MSEPGPTRDPADVGAALNRVDPKSGEPTGADPTSGESAGVAIGADPMNGELTGVDRLVGDPVNGEPTGVGHRLVGDPNRAALDRVVREEVRAERRIDPRFGLPVWAVRMTSWNIVILLAAAVLWLLIWLCLLFRAAVVPTLLALLGAALLQPLANWMVARGRSRRFAATTGCLIVVVALGGTVWFVSTALVNSAAGLARALENVSKRAGSGSIDELLSSAANGLHNLGSGAAGSLLSGVVQGLALAAQLVTGSVLGLALVFFFLRDGHRFPEFVDAQVSRGPAAVVLQIARRAYDAMAGFMQGTTLIALIDATLILIGLLILGIPGAPGLAALVFLGAYVPFIGAFLSGAVAVLVALGANGWGTALWTLGIVLAVQMVEGNLLQPVIQSRTVSLHPAIVMLAVTAGTAVGGIVGALLAVPITAAATGIVAELRAVLGSADAGPPEAAPVPE